MTTLLILKKRKTGDLWLSLKAARDELAREPKQDAVQVLFSSDSSQRGRAATKFYRQDTKTLSFFFVSSCLRGEKIFAFLQRFHF
jgi:hypothetical protein